MHEISLKEKIYTIRNKQVMLDRDLAEYYQIKPFRLREQVKRNQNRFPKDFCFQLNSNEVDFMVSQNAIPSKKHLGGTNPLVFTEQGVASLATVLKSKIAAETHIAIMRAFVAMRNFLQDNQGLFQRIERTEQKLLDHDKNFSEIFSQLKKPTDKTLFYDNQLVEAQLFIAKLINKANKEIILIDNYIDEKTFLLLEQRKKNIPVTIYTKQNITNKNYTIKHFIKSHDRFLIIDNQLYHIGASLKDAGKKWFAIAKLDNFSYNAIRNQLN